MKRIPNLELTDEEYVDFLENYYDYYFPNENNQDTNTSGISK